MFDDLKVTICRQPRPASLARLRAMARQFIRRDAEEVASEWDPEATDTVSDLVRSTRALSIAERAALRELLVASAPASPP